MELRGYGSAGRSRGARHGLYRDEAGLRGGILDFRLLSYAYLRHPPLRAPTGGIPRDSPHRGGSPTQVLLNRLADLADGDLPHGQIVPAGFLSQNLVPRAIGPRALGLAHGEEGYHGAIKGGC